MQFRMITPGEAWRFDDFIRSTANGHLFQSYMWGEVKKPDWEPLRVVLEEEGRIVAAASILKRKLPVGRRTIFYLPRGPVMEDWDDADVLAAIIDGIRALAMEHRAVLVKIDPCIMEGQQTPAAALRRIGFQPANVKRDFGGVQPRYTFRLDLQGELDQIMGRFPKKIRYKIRYAYKRGLQFVTAGEKELPQFMQLMDKTADRGNFVNRKIDYFQKLFRILSPENAINLTLGLFEGRVITAGITFAFGDKAWAAYGAQSESHRNIYAYHALIWERIKWAKGKGARWFDFYGVPGEVGPDHPLYGIYYFKKSFGGNYCAFIGELDLVLSRGHYLLWRHLSPPIYNSVIFMIRLGRRIAASLFSFWKRIFSFRRFTESGEKPF